MQPTFIVSSNIDAAGYQRGALYLRFKSGVAYKYENTPYSVYDALVKAESAGQFFHRNVRSKYKYERLNFDPFTNRHMEKAA